MRKATLIRAVVAAAAVVTFSVIGGAAPAMANANTTLHITGGTAISLHQDGWVVKWCDTSVDGLHVRAYVGASSTGEIRLVGSYAPSQLCELADTDLTRSKKYDYLTVCTEVECHAWSYRF